MAHTNVRDADPCSFLEQSVATVNGLKRDSTGNDAMTRCCWWTTDAFALGVLVRWDRNMLVDFGQGYPVLVGTDVDLGGQSVVMAKSAVKPICAAQLYAPRATIVQIVVAYQPPATA